MEVVKDESCFIGGQSFLRGTADFIVKSRFVSTDAGRAGR